MANIKLLNREKITTRVVYKELRLYLEYAKNDYDDTSLYLTRENGKSKYVIGYRPSQSIFKVNNCIVNWNEYQKLKVNDWYITASNLDGDSSNEIHQNIEGKPISGRDSRYRLKIVAGDQLGLLLPSEVLEAIVTEDHEKGIRMKPIIVGYKISTYHNYETEELIKNEDGTLHCMTKIQYQNLNSPE
ncbi:hypothetical protein [Lacinutrix undariae]